MKITEHDAITGETIEREATPEEEAQFAQDVALITMQKKEEADLIKAQEVAKASAIAKLAALGLTPEEISAIS
jgi:hypothetical protein